MRWRRVLASATRSTMRSDACLSLPFFPAPFVLPDSSCWGRSEVGAGVVGPRLVFPLAVRLFSSAAGLPCVRVIRPGGARARASLGALAFFPVLPVLALRRHPRGRSFFFERQPQGKQINRQRNKRKTCCRFYFFVHASGSPCLCGVVRARSPFFSLNSLFLCVLFLFHFFSLLTGKEKKKKKKAKDEVGKRKGKDARTADARRPL